MEKVVAPFTDEQVKSINKYQHSYFHPFTCCSPEDIPECLRAVREVNGEIVRGTSDGVLIASTEGLVCPCGKYYQNWVHKFMAEYE